MLKGGVHIVRKAVGRKVVVAQVLVIFKWYGAKLAAVAFIDLLLFVLEDYWLLQSMLWKKITMCNIAYAVRFAIYELGDCSAVRLTVRKF